MNWGKCHRRGDKLSFLGHEKDPPRNGAGGGVVGPVGTRARRRDAESKNKGGGTVFFEQSAVRRGKIHETLGHVQDRRWGQEWDVHESSELAGLE